MALGRIVVVGCGSIGRCHARIINNRSDVVLELCEPDPVNLAQALDEVGAVPTHTSFQEMIATKPEMVIIATPHFLHAEQSIAALLAGIHVLCEKPMSDSLENANRMWNVVKQNGAVFSVGFTLHFYPAMKAIKDMIASGDLGSILHTHWHIGTYITLMNSVSRYQATTEGALLLDYVHQPDLLSWWFNKQPKAVFAVGHQGGNQELQSNPNILLLTIEYDDNFLATIHLNYAQYPQRAYCEIIGDKKSLLYDMMKGEIHVSDYITGCVNKQDFAVNRDDMFEAEHQAFLDAVNGKRLPESPADEAIVSMKIIDAAMTSWRQNRRIEIVQ